MTLSIAENPDPASRRREWGLIALLTFVAAVLRFWRFGRLGLTHFDEGIYAFAGLWTLSPGGLGSLDPQVIPYAPPGFPVLVGLGYSVLGVTDAVPLLVAGVSGVLTIPVVGWLGRRTFGTGAGAASAAFAAMALPHVAFSRKGLTDAPFLLAWLIAAGLGGRFLERPGFARSLAFGVAVGVAQNLKYNGWIAGAVVIAAALLGLVRSDDRRPAQVARTFGFGVVAVLIAGACYWPWFEFVERHGGYADLVRHHREYVGGLRSWGPFWRLQLAQVVALSGGAFWGCMTGLVALVATLAVNGRSRLLGRSRSELAQVMAALVLGVAVLSVVADLGWWIGVLMALPLVADERPARRIVGVWWIILSVMTPFYHPYARLWLPLHAVGWLLLAGMVAAVTFGDESLGRWTGTRSRRVVAALGALAILAIAGGHWGDRRPRPIAASRFFEPTDSLRSEVGNLGLHARGLQTFNAGRAIRVFVLGRRPLAFYAALQGEFTIQLLSDERGLVDGPIDGCEWAVVDEAQIAQGKPWITRRSDVRRRWSPERTFRTWLDPVTQLDLNPGLAFTRLEPGLAPVVQLVPRVTVMPPDQENP